MQTAYTLRLLEDNLQQVFNVPGEIMANIDNFLPNINRILQATYKDMYYMSDQKKCGLTFPMELIYDLYEVAYEETGYDLFLAIKGYDNCYIKYNESFIKAGSSPGLGQCNFAISCCVAILFEMYKDNQSFTDRKLEGWFYNDDQTIKVETDPFSDMFEPFPDYVKDVFTGWDTYMESFGLSIHKKKPYACAAGLMLERAGRGYPVSYYKTFQWFAVAFNCLLEPNIALAKQYFAQTYMQSVYEGDSDILNGILHQYIIPYWGEEFFHKECKLYLIILVMII
jgi:hypothetical protein